MSMILGNILLQTLCSGLVFPVAATVLGLLSWPLIMTDAFLLNAMQWIGMGLLTGLISSVLMATPFPQVSNLMSFMLLLLFVSPMGIGFVWLMGTLSVGALATGAVVTIILTLLFFAVYWLQGSLRIWRHRR